VDHVSFDTPLPQPPRQPQPVPTRFIGDRDPTDGTARPDCLVPPAMKQMQQRRLIGRNLLQRLPP